MKEEWQKCKEDLKGKEIKQFTISIEAGVSLKTVNGFLNGRTTTKKMENKIKNAISKLTLELDDKHELDRKKIDLALLANIYINLPEAGQTSLITIARELESLSKIMKHHK